jgi:broad specificity phosphatase PhoE
MALYIQSYPIYHHYVSNKLAYLRLRDTSIVDCRTILFASHNSRIRCFVESVTDPKVYDRYRQADSHPTAYRFKNCAILSIRIKRGCSNSKIELIYSGHIDDANRQGGMYYVAKNDPSTSDRDRVFETQDVPLQKLGIDASCIDTDLEILIIRHGEAEHNLRSYYDRPLNMTNEDTIASAIRDNKLDTDLTSDGRAETKKAAEFVIEYLKPRTDRIHHVFCSILKRTRQTLDEMLGVMRDKSDLARDIKKMVVAPCSREIKYGDVRGCFVRDPDPAFFDNPTNRDDLRFNQPFCSFLNVEQSALPPECQRISNYSIDPTYYVEYHRSSKCSGLATNMAEILVDVVKKLECE